MSFLPTDLSGLGIWLDAADASTITESGGLVSQWDDKSGNLRHVTATGAQRPTFSTDKLVFDGTGNYMLNSSPFLYNSVGCTVFAVFKSDGGNGIRVYSEGNTADSDTSYGLMNSRFDNGTNIQYPFIRSDSGTSILGNPTLSAIGYFWDNTLKICHTVDTGAAVTGWVSGVEGELTRAYTRSSALTLNRFAIGAYASNTPYAYFVGDMHEFIGFSRVLTPAEQDQVGRYLAVKWGCSFTPQVYSSVAVTNFVPTDIANCAAWYDAADVSTVTISTGVSQWNDKSGNSRHVAQGIAANQPAYTSGQYLTFDGANDHLFHANPYMYAAGEITVFAVLKSNGGTADVLLAERSSASTSPIYYIGYSTDATTTDDVSCSVRNGLAVSQLAVTSFLGSRVFDNGRNILTIQDTGSLMTSYVNGVVGTTPQAYTRSGSLSLNRHSIGNSISTSGSAYLAMNLHELIIFTRALTQFEIDRVNSYLGEKWNIYPYGANKFLNLEVGSHTSSGSPLGMVANRILSLASETYSTTGYDLAMLANRILALESGGYSYTGSDLDMLVHRLLSLDPGSYSITGEDIALLITKIFALEASTYGSVGSDASLLIQRLLSLGSGEYQSEGQDLTISLLLRFILGAGQYTSQGFDIDMEVIPVAERFLAKMLVTLYANNSHVELLTTKAIQNKFMEVKYTLGVSLN